MAVGHILEPDLDLIREVKRVGGGTLKRCYQCATCSVVCGLSPADHPFPRKEMLLAQWGQRDRLVADPDVWLCHQCNDCSTRCPRGARPGDVLAAIRSYVYEHFAFPRFMGRALSLPAALPWLILFPVLILVASIVTFAPTNPEGSYLFTTAQTIDFNLFLPHSSVDALFVIGNIMIFLFAAIGFLRFWKSLNRGAGAKKLSFVSGLIGVVTEILAHRRFKTCETNRPRAWAHLLILYGFIGAMITTGCIFVFIFIPHYLNMLGLESITAWFELPMELPHPIKILGVLSGFALLVGSGLLIYRRWTNRDQVGANGYTDYLFLYVLFVAGFTGLFSWLGRHSGLPMLAYGIYFAHIVSVFFLLWYMPYSKFAHMIYRTLALVHARQLGRLPRA